MSRSAGFLVHPGRWTLRVRLVTLTILLLAVISVAFAVVGTLSVRAGLTGQVDEQVKAGALRATRDGAQQGGGSPGARGPDLGPGPRGVTAVVSHGVVTSSTVFDPDRVSGPGPGVYPTLTAAQQQAVVLVADSAVSVSVSVSGSGSGSGSQQRTAGTDPPLTRLVPSGPLSPVTRELPGLGRYRLVGVGLPDGTVRVAGAPLADVDDAVGGLLRTELVVALAGMAVVGLLGGVLIRRSLAPLTRVAATATRVSELPLARGEVLLAERVPAADTDPGTEVGQVGAALNRMLGHVSSALVARQQSETRVRTFVADASHELRTPLTAIRGYAELTRRSHEPVPLDVAYALGRVESEAQRMTTLVEDLLLLARLDSGRPLDSDPVDLSALVVDVTSDAHAAGPDHPLTLDLPDGPVVVPGDVARLHQVLANLLANTRTHTAPGTPVTVSLRRSPTDAVLSVVDAGPGIAPALLPHVFARFARGDSSRARTAGSTGLGLAIVQAVATAHHGTVEVASVPGRTVFTVTLPADPAPRPPGGSPARPPTDPPIRVDSGSSGNGTPAREQRTRESGRRPPASWRPAPPRGHALRPADPAARSVSSRP